MRRVALTVRLEALTPCPSGAGLLQEQGQWRRRWERYSRSEAALLQELEEMVGLLCEGHKCLVCVIAHDVEFACVLVHLSCFAFFPVMIFFPGGRRFPYGHFGANGAALPCHRC